MSEMRTATVGGRRIAYQEWGDARAASVLTLVHGFPLGVRMWAAQQQAFTDHRVIVPALPGFDGSDLLDETTMDGYAGAVLALLAHLGVEQSVWCGLSMGGYVTFGALRQEPKRLSGVVLADTRSVADTPEGKAGRQKMLELLAREGADAVATDMMPKLVGKASQAARPEVEKALRQMIGSQPPQSIAAAIHALISRPDATAQLAAISAPTLVIVGEDDVLTPPSDSEKMHAAIRGSTLVRIPGAGHMSNMENPEAFNAAVSALLKSG